MNAIVVTKKNTNIERSFYYCCYFYFEKKLQYLKDTPIGARSHKRQLKPMEELIVGGG